MQTTGTGDLGEPGEGGTTGESRATEDASSDGAIEAPSATFVADVLPILRGSCTCHGAGTEAGVDLADDAAYETLVSGTASVGVAFVQPGDPDASYLVLKLRGQQATVGGAGSRMPLGRPLDDDEIATIEAWITGGARES